MDIKTTKAWMDSIFNINKELDYERRNIETSLARVEKLETKKEELFYVISAIKNPTYKAVLHMRYIEGRKWELARIIGGTNITETTLKSAEEMLNA